MNFEKFNECKINEALIFGGAGQVEVPIEGTGNIGDEISAIARFRNIDDIMNDYWKRYDFLRSLGIQP